MIEFVKKHWAIVAGGFAGLLVLYFLYSSMRGGSSKSSASSPVQGTSDQLQALTTASNLQSAQINGATTQTAYQASTIDNATAASLQLGEVQTAAELAAAQSGQQTDLLKTQDTNRTAVALAHVTADAAVSQTAIQAATIENVVKVQTDAAVSVNRTQLSVVGSQIGALMKGSKHFATDLTAITPLLTAELGNTGASVAASNTKASVEESSAKKTGAIAGAIASGVSSIAGGLLGPK